MTRFSELRSLTKGHCFKEGGKALFRGQDLCAFEVDVQGQELPACLGDGRKLLCQLFVQLSILGENGLSINLYTIAFILFFGIGYGAYYATADMPIPMVADCADYETYRSGKFIPGIMGTLFSLVDKLVSSLSATVVSIVLLILCGIDYLPTKTSPYVDGMNWAVIILFCLIPMIAWALTLISMKGYELDGQRVKTINAVNAARKQAIANGMSMEEAMATITDETVAK